MTEGTIKDRPVLIFHGVGTPARALEPGEARFWISLRRFRDILDRVVQMGDAAPEITFDDGNASDASIALPELEQRGLRATFFVLAGRLGAEGSLSPDDVRRLADAGQDIGSHGHGHRDWRQLDRFGRAQEYRDARRRLADLAGRDITRAAAPFGLYDRQVIADLKAEGFVRLYTSDRGRAELGAFLQPRSCFEAGWSDAALERALIGQVGLARRPRRLLGLARKRLLPLRLRS